MKNPRLNVTIPPEHREVILAIAAYNGTSQSKVVSELIEAALPVLTRMVEAVKAVQLLDAEKRDAIVATLLGAQEDAEHTAAVALALLERIAAPTADSVTDAQRPTPPPTRAATGKQDAAGTARGTDRPPLC